MTKGRAFIVLVLFVVGVVSLYKKLPQARSALAVLTK
jgi:hypothetical protein